MKTLFILFFASLLAFNPYFDNVLINKTKNTNNSTSGFAVVELFTSEGCSSCPSADELIAKVENEINGKPVYILAFHVDYWNRLGWTDPYSMAQYSERQNQYAHWLNLSTVYTPQIVVNGKKEFVGSENWTLHNVIKSNLVKSSSMVLSLDNANLKDGDILLNYHISGINPNSIENTELFIALIQKQATTHVKSGENGGRTLNHVQIVRNFKAITLNGNVAELSNAKTSIQFNPNYISKDFEIIGFLQNQKTGEIIAANRLSLSKASN